DQTKSAKRSPQYIASLAATLGSLSGGMAMGWSSAAGEDGKYLESSYGVQISATEFSWITSLTPIGSGAICIPIGLLAGKIGRIGRFILGLASGAFCVLVPMYMAEIGEKEIRGCLGSYEQLLGTAGVLLSYIAGTFVDIRKLSILSAVLPLIF
ncbi:LOW QUALITY PROTEIN: solute carrier family 2, facilitated glucose transporter member 8-like, partial [Ceratina calcarata]|uniref:LOW QUALITY PROTEIN: solute carrier family 2, facilitated glucose transporter member 8-like n=1 Tax=Ceratina calcarata TaxID=156304 RepID=A0AAJ7N8X4_9HYME